jgi:hypothetical protein
VIRKNRDSNILASKSLRELIHSKRKTNQMQAALTLAKLGRRIHIQGGNKFATDEISRKTFELYLELNPDDAEVQRALQFLSNSVTKKFNYLRAALLGVLVLTGISATLIHFYALPIYEYVLPRPQVAKITVPVKPVVVHQSSASSSSAPNEISQQPIVIRAVGDVVLGSNYPHNRLPDDRNKKRIAELSQTFKGADVVVGNLEGVLYDEGESRKDISQTGYYVFRMPESYASTLHEMGFNVLSVANNHSMDFGVAGFRATKRALLAADILPSGAPGGDIAILNIRKTKIAFLSYSYLSNMSPMNNETQVKFDIERAKQMATIVIVTVHAGGEGEAAGGTPEADEYFMNEYRGNIRKFSALVIDAGADAVFGHGPHLIRPYEIYHGKPIFFSLGNFVGYGSLSKAGKLGSSIVAEVRLTPQGNLMGAGIIPLKMDEFGIPSPDYSSATLATLDGLLDKNLDKQPVLELKAQTADAKPNEIGARIN